MAGENQPAAAPAAPGIDQEALAKLVASSVAAALKPFGEQLAKLQSPAPTPAAPAAGEKDKPLTAADVAKIVGDAIKEQTKASTVSNARNAYITEKLAGIPQVYKDLMPNTDDAQQLAAAEQQIREKFRADAKAMGFTPKEIGSQGGGKAPTTPGAPVDLSKLSPTDLITEGLKHSTTQGPQGVSTRTQVATQGA